MKETADKCIELLDKSKDGLNILITINSDDNTKTGLTEMVKEMNEMKEKLKRYVDNSVECDKILT